MPNQLQAYPAFLVNVRAISDLSLLGCDHRVYYSITALELLADNASQPIARIDLVPHGRMLT